MIRIKFNGLTDPKMRQRIQDQISDAMVDRLQVVGQKMGRWIAGSTNNRVVPGVRRFQEDERNGVDVHVSNPAEIAIVQKEGVAQRAWQIVPGLLREI